MHKLCVIRRNARIPECVLIKDIGQRLPVEVVCSLYEGQQRVVSQSLSKTYSGDTLLAGVIINKKRGAQEPPCMFTRAWFRYILLTGIIIFTAPQSNTVVA